MAIGGEQLTLCYCGTGIHCHYCQCADGSRKVRGPDPKAAVGIGKPGVADVPPLAILHLGAAMADGAQKYGRMNWRSTSVDAGVYYNAALRHLLAWWDGEQVASDSGLPHLAHAMASLAILLDAEAQGVLHDDRPRPAGMAPAYIAAKSRRG